MKRVESVKHSLSSLCLASFPLWNVLNRYDVVSEDAAFPVDIFTRSLGVLAANG